MYLWRSLLFVLLYYLCKNVEYRFTVEELGMGEEADSVSFMQRDTICNCLLIALVLCMLIRYTHLVFTGRSMYLFDFCNFSNALLVMHLIFAPKCDWLFATCYFYTFGSLIYIVMAFKHS